MALNIKNPEVERLAAEVAELTGESKTEAVRRALTERRERLALRVAAPHGLQRLLQFLQSEVWPAIPPDKLGKRVSRTEREEALGYGPDGV